jgi:ATP-dependent exoDNAse (exonuclease V) alpha subunit
MAGTDQELTLEQAAVLRMALEGRSLFCMGSAGTGKSTTLRRVITDLRWRPENNKGVYVTAPTGIAAINIGGSTIHSALGLGLAASDAPQLVRAMRARRLTELRRDLKILVIDECSMLSAAFFEKIDQVLRIVKEIDTPFGGVQVILFGDFHQLPPVFVDTDDVRLLFESPLFKVLVGGCAIELSTIFRQRDPRLLAILQDVRRGILTDATREAIGGLHRELPPGGTAPLHLFCHNAGVDALNAASLADLPGMPVTLKAIDVGHASHVERLNRDSLIPAVLTLKPGALVMLLMNVPNRGLGNGSRGHVVEIRANDVLVDFGTVRIGVVRTTFGIYDASGAELATRTQFPLKLSWAATIHKSQGQSIKYLHADLSGTFAPGQGYVALSRATDIETLRVTNASDRSFWVDPRVIAFTEVIRASELV